MGALGENVIFGLSVSAISVPLKYKKKKVLKIEFLFKKEGCAQNDLKYW